MKKSRVYVLLSVVLIFLITVSFYLTYFWLPEKGKVLVESFLSLRSGGAVKIGKLKLHFPATLVAEDVSYTGPQGTFYAEKIRAILSTLQGIFGRARVRELSLENFSLHLSIRKEGEAHVLSPLKKFKMPHFIYPEFDNVKFKNGELHVKYKGEKDEVYEIYARDVSGSGKLKIPSFFFEAQHISTGRTLLKVAGFNFKFSGVDFGDIRFDRKGEKLSIENFSIEDTEECRLKVKSFLYETDSVRAEMAVLRTDIASGCAGMILTAHLRGKGQCVMEGVEGNLKTRNFSSAHIQCTVNQFGYKKFDFGKVMFDGSLQDARLTLSHFRAESMGGIITGEGIINVADKVLRLNVDLEGVTIQDIVTDLGLPHSRVTGSIYARGVSVTSSDFKHFGVQGRMRVSQFFTFSRDWREKDKLIIVQAEGGTLDVKGTFGPRAFQMDSADIYIEGTKKLHVTGRIGYEDMLNLTVFGRDFPLDYLGHIAGIKVSGILRNVESNIFTDYSDLKVHGFFHAERGRIFGFDFEKMFSKVNYERQELAFTGIKGTSPGGRITGGLSLFFSENGGGYVRGKLFSPAILVRSLKNEFADINYYISLVSRDNVLARDVSLKIDGEFDSVELRFYGTFDSFKVFFSPYMFAGRVEGFFKNGVFSLRALSDRAVYELNVRPSGSDKYRTLMNLKCEGIPVKTSFFSAVLTGELTSEWGEELERLTGVMMVKTSDKGLLPDEQLTFDLYFNDRKVLFKERTGLLSGWYEPRGAVELVLSTYDGVPLVFFKGERVLFKGRLSVYADGERNVSLSFPEDSTFYAFNHRYTFYSGWSISLRGNRIKVVRTGSVGVLMRSNTGDEIKFRGSGSYSLFLPSLLNVILPVFFPGKLDISFQGTFYSGKNQLVGTFKLSSLSFSKVSIFLQEPVMHMVLKWPVLSLKSEMTDRLIFNFSSGLFSINLKDFMVEMGSMPVFAFLCTGGGSERRVDFECRNITRRAYYDMSWYSMISGGGGNQYKLKSPFPLNVKLHLTGLSLYSDSQDITVNGILSLTAEKSVQIKGELDFVGRYKFRDVWFEVKNGVFSFSPVRPGVPYVSATASTEIIALQGIEKRYRVTVEMEGWVDRLKMKFSSVPALPENQILSLITFGVPETGNVAGGQQASNVEKAVLGMEMLFGREMKDVGRRIGISELSLTVGYEELTQRLASRLRLLSRLSRRMSVEYERDIVSQDQSLAFMYHISRNITAEGVWDNHAFDISEGQTSSIGNFGVKIKASFDFDW